VLSAPFWDLITSARKPRARKRGSAAKLVKAVRESAL